MNILMKGVQEIYQVQQNRVYRFSYFLFLLVLVLVQMQRLKVFSIRLLRQLLRFCMKLLSSFRVELQISMNSSSELNSMIFRLDSWWMFFLILEIVVRVVIRFIVRIIVSRVFLLCGMLVRYLRLDDICKVLMFRLVISLRRVMKMLK